jgi:glucosamine-6-phosphate deaminase
MESFEYCPSAWMAFQDMDAVRRCRGLSRGDLVHHANPEYRISIHPDADLPFLWLTDMFRRIRDAAEQGTTCVLITPQPWPEGYRRLAHLLNTFQVDCRGLWTFNMDEYANEHGDTPPETWPQGFLYSMKQHFYAHLDPRLRPPEHQILGPTRANIDTYGTMLTDLGGADCCYSGPGWTGHLAFIEPDAPEFRAPDLESWMQLGPRICTLSPFTIAQNSLHGAFGASGDLWRVPPKAATIGPAQVLEAKARIDMHGICVGGSAVSWQRLITRLVTHGPVTPLLPESILQTVPTDVWIAESIAEPVGPRWEFGY